MAQITYSDKVALNENPDIPDINKVTDDDMNEIKSAHNDTDTKNSAMLSAFGLTTNTWVSGTSYTVGTIVVYNYKLYECISATSGTTAPSSDTTHWEEISILVN